MDIRRLRRAGLSTGSLLLAALACIFAIASFVNSSVITSVLVTFEGEEEPRDVTLRRASEERLPDYRVDLVARGDRHALGVQPNTSAADGITFHVARPVPRRALQEIVLIEDDPLSNDVLARVQGQADELAANGYRFTLSVGRSLDGGLIWFFDTPIGKAILWGIGVAVLIVVLSLLAPLFG